MTRIKICVCTTMWVSFVIATPAFGGVVVSYAPVDAVIPSVGETTNMELWANFTDPIVAWGLDLTIMDPPVAGLTGTLIDGSWDDTTTLDGDGLAGVLYPTGLTGDV